MQPQWVGTSVIEDQVCRQLGLFFELPAERSARHRNSLLNALKSLVISDHAERRDAGDGRDAKQWRWKQEKQMALAELRDVADAQVI